MIDKLILGTVQLGIPYGINNTIGKPDLSQVKAILNLAKEKGIQTLDTAKAYGNASELIGNYQKEFNFFFKVISKFHIGNSKLEENCISELKALNIKQFEAYLFHSFYDFETASLEIINSLKHLKKTGLINKIGVSIYGNDQFEKAIDSEYIDIIQLPYNLLDNDYQRGRLIQKAKHNGKELHVRSVFLQGLFFMNLKTIPKNIEKLRPYLEKINNVALSEKLTQQELALFYVLKNPLIDKVLIGVDSFEHLQSNILALEKIKYVQEELIAKINNIKVIETDLLNPVNWN